MSVLINADTSDGLKFTSDTSGEIKLQSGGTDIATVDSSGITIASGKTIADSTGTIYPLTSSTAVTASGGETAIDFTGIPSWVKKITVMMSNLDTAGGGTEIQVQLGTSGGFVTSGYIASTLYVTTSNVVSRQTTTSGFHCGGDAASGVYGGNGTLALIDPSSGTWTWSFGGTRITNTTIYAGGGYGVISGTVTQLRITTVTGTETFNSGSKFNILYE